MLEVSEKCLSLQPITESGSGTASDIEPGQTCRFHKRPELTFSLRFSIKFTEFLWDGQTVVRPITYSGLRQTPKWIGNKASISQGQKFYLVRKSVLSSLPKPFFRGLRIKATLLILNGGQASQQASETFFFSLPSVPGQNLEKCGTICLTEPKFHESLLRGRESN